MTAVELGRVGQDGLELGDGLLQLGQLLLEVDAGQPGEAAELHVEDVVGLDLGELEGLGHQAAHGPRAVLAGPDGGDDLVDHVEGPEQTLDDVGPGLGLLQPVLADGGG